jgi:hypothetical protein
MSSPEATISLHVVGSATATTLLPAKNNTLHGRLQTNNAVMFNYGNLEPWEPQDVFHRGVSQFSRA